MKESSWVLGIVTVPPGGLMIVGGPEMTPASSGMMATGLIVRIVTIIFVASLVDKSTSTVLSEHVGAGGTTTCTPRVICCVHVDVRGLRCRRYARTGEYFCSSHHPTRRTNIDFNVLRVRYPHLFGANES